jgi:hypothetical protein
LNDSLLSVLISKAILAKSRTEIRVKDSLPLTPSWEEKYRSLCVTEAAHVSDGIRGREEGAFDWK